MSLTDRLKKYSHPGIVASAALAGALAMGKMPTYHASRTDTPSPTQAKMANSQIPNTSASVTSSPAFNQKIEQLFDISGTDRDIQAVKQSLWTMSNTPEGVKLLEDLGSNRKPNSKIMISLSDQLDSTDYGQANPKKEGFPVELNADLSNDSAKLSTTLFHELCHVRQYREGVGTLGDLPEQKYDLTIAQEAEARFQTSLLASHSGLVQDSGLSNRWMDQSLIQDAQVLNTVKSGLLSQNETLSEEMADKQARKEVLKSIVSGENTPTVNQFLSEKEAQRFRHINQDWLNTYSLCASAHAYDDFYPTMHANGVRSTELIDRIAGRLGVDKSSLLAPSGIDLLNVQKNSSGNIMSAERVSRKAHENLGSIKCTYDTQNRPLSIIELDSNQALQIDRKYTYGTNELPLQLQEKTPKGQKVVNYDLTGTPAMVVTEMDGFKTTTHYIAGQKSKEIEQNTYGTAESTYKNGEKTDYIYKTNDGTVVDEFHKPSVDKNSNSSSSEKNLPLNVLRSKRGQSY